MAKGRIFSPEVRDRRDPETGLAFRQLTDGPDDSHHLYFTNPGWYDGGRRLLFVSTRDGSTNLFGMEIESGAFTQLTDEQRVTDELLFTCLNPMRPEAYFWRKGSLVALDLETLDERSLYETPDGYANNILTVTCDGAQVCIGIYEDLQSRFDVDLLKGYVGFEDYWAAMPRSVIITVNTGTGEAREVFSENYWVGHVSASPTVPHILTYCHEGPWDKVDNRIWGLDLRNGRNWPIYPRKGEESVGHEYWMQDGVTVGFHGTEKDGPAFTGAVRYDDTDLEVFPFPRHFTHIHSNDLNLATGDGTNWDPMLYVWTFESGQEAKPVAVLRHGCSASVQARHVHPRFNPDSSRIVFVSDDTGVGNIYDVSVANIRATGLLDPEKA